MSLEKNASYQVKSSYSTLNSLTEKTQNIWIVFHGMGYLSRYFIRYFNNLDPETNYIIAPQAPSKFYQDPEFKHVGASWLTRENTLQETENVLNYTQAVWEAETRNIKLAEFPKLIVLGYSQGVSIATRWIAKYKITCQQLIIHSGGVPVELITSDFEHLKDQTKVLYLYGDKDPYITEARKTEEQLRAKQLFNKLETKVFHGKHEVYTSIFPKLV